MCFTIARRSALCVLSSLEAGQQINEVFFEPVYENEQERKRFINRMFDEVRTFEGADGKKSALNKDGAPLRRD